MLPRFGRGFLVRSLGGIAVSTAMSCGTARENGGVSDSGGSGTTTASGSTSTTGTTSTVSGTTSGEQEEDDEAGFIPIADVQPVGCELWANDCPRGFKCMPRLDGNHVCTPLLPDPPGAHDACETPWEGEEDECADGHFCSYWAPDTPAQCFPMCAAGESAETCEDACSACLPVGETGFGRCLESCSPLLQDCSFGHLCMAFPGASLPSCWPPLQPGASHLEACPNGLCAPGLICTEGAVVPGCDAQWCCTSFCEIGETDPCPEAGPEVECVPWFEDPDLRAQCGPTLGVCRAPR